MMAETNRKAIQSSGTVAHWMNSHGIPFEGRVTVTKEQLQTLQRPGEPLKIQLYGTGLLQGPGYQGELAKTARPLKDSGYEVIDSTPALIASELARVALEYFEREHDSNELLRHLPPKLAKRFPEPLKLDSARQRWLKLRLLRWSKQDLRRAMKDLEDEGLLERRTVDGRLLRDLSPEEQRRLPSGNIRLYFWLRPKPVSREVIAEQWVTVLRGLAAAASSKKTGSHEMPTCLPSPRRILSLFGLLDRVERQKLTDAEYQQSIRIAYEKSKKTFCDLMGLPPEPEQVVKSCLPEGVSPALPEVAKSSGRIKESFKERSERKVSTDPSSVGRLTVKADQPTDRPKEQAEESNPFKEKARAWLEANVPISGYELQDPELQRIAATIHSDEDLEDFKTAALRQKNPRGWRVYARIAERLAELRATKPVAAKAATVGGADDQIRNLYRQMKEGKNG